MSVCRVLVSVVVLLPHFALSYPDSVPNSACDWLAPYHQPYTEPAPGPSPYRLRTYHSRALTDIPVPVCVVGSQPFLGFMVQAKDAGSGEVVGSWQVAADSPASTMTCYNPNDTVTHNSRISKQVLPLSWLAPQHYNGTVVFKAAVVSSYTTYWADITSTAVSVVAV